MSTSPAVRPPGRAGYRFSDEDLDFLTSPDGAAALTGASSYTLVDDTMLADLTALRKAVGGQAAAVAETVRLRRLAVGKLGDVAATWLFTDEALQQATPAPVARHRADRLGGRPVHDLTCSIGADLLALCRGSETVVGSDLDPIRVRMAQWNMSVSGFEPRIVVADALVPFTSGMVLYADPARRDTRGRRITSADTVPSVRDLDEVYRDRPPVLRLPPGIDYDELARPGEVEIVSLDGGAREAVLWPAELARVARRATVLSTGGTGFELTSDESDDVSPILPPDRLFGQWLVDPDAAVVRAHLVRHYAARHDLRLLDPHLAYLAGPVAPPGTRAFRVVDVAPYTLQTVAGWVRRDGVGTIEIKQRGTSVVPDELRQQLRPALGGDTTVGVTLVIARIVDQHWAFWCLPSAVPGSH